MRAPPGPRKRESRPLAGATLETSNTQQQEDSLGLGDNQSLAAERIRLRFALPLSLARLIADAAGFREGHHA